MNTRIRHFDASDMTDELGAFLLDGDTRPQHELDASAAYNAEYAHERLAELEELGRYNTLNGEGVTDRWQYEVLVSQLGTLSEAEEEHYLKRVAEFIPVSEDPFLVNYTH